MGNKHMKKFSKEKEIEKIKGTKSCKVALDKRNSLNDKASIDNYKRNIPDTISKEFSTNVSFSENTFCDIKNEGKS